MADLHVPGQHPSQATRPGRHERAWGWALLLEAILAVSACGPSQPPLDDDRAIERLVRHVDQSGIYAGWTTTRCLRFVLEASSDDAVEIAVREKHEDGCPGAPGVQPIVDRYRVLRVHGDIEIFDPSGVHGYEPVPQTAVQ